MADWKIHHNFMLEQLNGTNAIDFDTDDIRIVLIDSTTAPVPATHDFLNDLNANEVSGSNYTTNGSTVGSMSVALNTGVVTVDGDTVTFAQHASGFNDARYALLVMWSGTASTSPIIASLDLVSDKGNVDSDFIVGPTSAGYTKLQIAA